MTMTRKHFEALAKVAAYVVDGVTRQYVAGALADVCEQDNPRFDRVRFAARVAELASGSVAREKPDDLEGGTYVPSADVVTPSGANWTQNPTDGAGRALPPDVRVENHGSLCLVRGLTDAGSSWLIDNTQDDAQHFCGALVVEPRYLDDLVRGMRDAGLVVV